MVFSGGMSEEVTTSEKAGQSAISTAPGHTTLALYYDNYKVVHRFEPGFCGKQLRVLFDTATPPAAIAVY